MCTPKFADLIPTSPDRSLLKLKDVLQNDLAITGQKTVPMLVGPTDGKLAMEATATFRVAEVRGNILSLGKLVRKSFNFSLGPRGRSMDKDGGSVPLYLERNSLHVEAHVLQRATRPGCVTAGTAVATTSSEPVPDVTTAPVLKTWSSIKELRARLQELGAPIYGTKDVIFWRLCEHEHVATKK